MITTDKKLLYLVIDPAMPREVLLTKLKEALEAGIDLLQIWNHWPEGFSSKDKITLIDQILGLAAPYRVPVLINEEWTLLKSCALQGVHFDNPPANLANIRQEIGRDFISGLTCGNEPERIQWANEHAFSYISFCSMFPSSSVDSCEIVREESVQKARQLSKLPVFLSGGLNPERITQLNHLDFQGIAIISGIMSAPSVSQSIRAYQDALNLKPTQS